MQRDGLMFPEKLGQVEVVGEGVAQLHGFCNVGIVYGRGEVLVVDTGAPMMGRRFIEALAATTSEPVTHVVYTHGHVDHVGGAPRLVAAADKAGHARPTVWAHALTPERFRRYLATWGWNNEVNRRQFQLPPGVDAFPKDFVAPDRTYQDTATFTLAGEPVELHHAFGETDDATWVWLPERRTALVGDLSVQSMPNTGNPNKTQRFTLGWAEALDAIAARRATIVIPGHGDPITGEARVAEVLGETARALRYVHDAVLTRLNAGEWPDHIVDADIQLPADLAAKPFLQPIYGCTPFVVRDVLRAYAGWWGGNPAELIPARRRDVARDVLDVAGRDALVAKTRALLDAGEARRALHLAVIVSQADPDDHEARALVADVCDAMVRVEPSYIARNFYRTAAATARS